MLSLSVSVDATDATALVAALQQTGEVRRLVSHVAAGAPRDVVLEADVTIAGADDVLAVLEDLQISRDAYRMARLDVIAPIAGAHEGVTAGGNVSWTEVLGDAEVNSRLIARYVALICASGVIAALGVITSNAILIVGAMAVSPDLLPICAVSVAIVRRRAPLARQALVTLVVGLALVAVVAGVLTAVLNATNVLPSHFRVGENGLSGLARTDYSTVLIALAAGVAAILSFETRASAAVGVAISVTTIPASAFLGVAIGSGEPGLGALLVLAVNVVLLIVSGTATLAVQHWRSPDN